MVVFDVCLVWFGLLRWLFVVVVCFFVGGLCVAFEGFFVVCCCFCLFG